jgi:hypothetical protein
VLAGRLIAAGEVTVTPAVAFETPSALAVMVADPAATPVTGAGTLVAFAAKLTVAGVVALLESLELRLTIRPPADAGPDRFSVRFCVEPALIARLPGEKLMVVPEAVPEVTCTLTGGNPLADAVIVADPALMPLTVGARPPAVAPCGMKMLSGATVTFEGSLLVSAMNTPPDGADVANVTGNGTDWPGATVTLAGSMIPEDDVAETVALAVAFPKFGVLAVIVAEPCARPVTGTFTLVAPAANVTVAVTLTTPGLLELRLAVSPAGAAPDRFSVKFPGEPTVRVRLPGEKKLLPVPATTCTCPLPGA